MFTSAEGNGSYERASRRSRWFLLVLRVASASILIGRCRDADGAPAPSGLLRSALIDSLLFISAVMTSCVASVFSMDPAQPCEEATMRSERKCAFLQKRFWVSRERRKRGASFS